MAKPSGNSPSSPIARPTSSSTPRPLIRPVAVWMPVTRSPSLVTTSPARRPFQAVPWSKMCPRPSHCVEACSGMKITSSAPPSPCGKPWLPRSASTPVSSMVCTGLVRRRQPFCGPLASNDWAREKLAPRRTSAAAARRLASSRKLSVPCTSSASPASPVGAAFRRGGDRGLRVPWVEREGVRHVGSSLSDRTRLPRPTASGKTILVMHRIDPVDTLA